MCCACGHKVVMMTARQALYSLEEHFEKEDNDARIVDGCEVRVVIADSPRAGHYGKVTVAGQTGAFVKFPDSGDAILFPLFAIERVRSTEQYPPAKSTTLATGSAPTTKRVGNGARR